MFGFFCNTAEEISIDHVNVFIIKCDSGKTKKKNKQKSVI